MDQTTIHPDRRDPQHQGQQAKTSKAHPDRQDLQENQTMHLDLMAVPARLAHLEQLAHQDQEESRETSMQS